MNLETAFLVLAFLAVSSGTLMLSIPIGLIVTGLMFAAAGVALLPREPRARE